jgi:hypothetical protein
LAASRDDSNYELRWLCLVRRTGGGSVRRSGAVVLSYQRERRRRHGTVARPAAARLGLLDPGTTMATREGQDEAVHRLGDDALQRPVKTAARRG